MNFQLQPVGTECFASHLCRENSFFGITYARSVRQQLDMWVMHMENPVIAAPEHKLYAEAGFARGRWSVSTGVQYVAGLYTSVKANGRGTENTEDFVLWNLRASLRVSRCLTLFARGENLLAQRYEINAGYPMPRATFIGGIRLDF